MLYHVKFTADVCSGRKPGSEHDMLLTAGSVSDAEVYVRWFFARHGVWFESANVSRQELESEPNIRDVRVSEIQNVVCYRGRVLADGQIPQKK